MIEDRGSDNGTWIVEEEGYVALSPGEPRKIDVGARIVAGRCTFEVTDDPCLAAAGSKG